MKTIFKSMACVAVLSLSFSLSLLNGAVAENSWTPIPMDAEKGRTPQAACYLPNNEGYEDESLSVQVEHMRRYDTDIIVARVTIQDPSQIRTAMASRYGTTSTVSPNKLAQRSEAVLAVNGDFFNFNSTGYLVRQGVVYREKTREMFDILIIDENGDLHILVDPTEEDVKAFPHTIVNSFNFGPALVVDGEIIETTKQLNIGKNKQTQRMGIAQVGPLSYLCVATEGPENKGSKGLTISQFAELMQDLGAKQAYNLDGGSSSAMILGGQKINALSSKKNRNICDILYFSTLVEAE